MSDAEPVPGAFMWWILFLLAGELGGMSTLGFQRLYVLIS